MVPTRLVSEDNIYLSIYLDGWLAVYRQMSHIYNIFRLVLLFLFLMNFNTFNMNLSLTNMQEWAANNATRTQIEDTVLYGYYSK